MPFFKRKSTVFYSTYQILPQTASLETNPSDGMTCARPVMLPPMKNTSAPNTSRADFPAFHLVPRVTTNHTGDPQGKISWDNTHSFAFRGQGRLRAGGLEASATSRFSKPELLRRYMPRIEPVRQGLGCLVL